MLAILNVGHGDTKLTFDPSKPDEVKRTKRIIADMLKLGYVIAAKDGDRWVRVTRFDPERTEYVVEETPRKQARRRAAVTTGRRLAAGSTPAVAVARSAGGMSVQIDSVERENLRRFDKFSGLREDLSTIAERVGEWAGIPMPLEDQPLVIDPQYPFAAALGREDQPPAGGEKIRNRFWSERHRGDVVVWNDAEGKLEWGIEHLSLSTLEIQTLGASYAWGVEQEAAALQTLATLVPHHAFKCYLLSGSFLESSARSGVTYCFRKLRPTLALRAGDEGMRVLAALCMHPIAYYSGSWAGAMCPTDDVIAHLTLMRADEKMYWRRCNQHPAYRPEAGLG